MVDYEKMLEKAQVKINSTAKDSIFAVKDLFTGIEWDKLTNGEKRVMGSRFKYAVSKGDIVNAEYIGKAKNNSSQYQVI